MGVRTICRLVLVGAVFIVWPGLAAAQAPPLWGGLPPGPHAVGFKTTWRLDYARRYNMTFDDKTSYAPGKAPRPILVNLWYPAARVADAQRRPHRDYLDIQSDDPRLATFAAKLAEYNRGVIASEVLGKPLAGLTDREKALLDQFLDTPTACVRNAAPAPGPFPLVLYHSGAGSSYEDNSVLCEFLASHGFVVLGSAFQENSGKSFNTDNREGSAGDLQFLIAHARDLPFVDWGRIGLIGHSAGAHAALGFVSRPGCAVDAVVSLDTTQDYHGVTNPLWEFPAHVLKNQANVKCPVLMVAGPDAFFELADSLRHAKRYYLTIPNLDHNDYIAQGHVHREWISRLSREDPMRLAPAQAEGEAARKARTAYRALCQYILHFLEGELRGDAASRDLLAKLYRDTRFGEDAPHVEYVPPGCTGPDSYRTESGVPPTPRQLRRLLREHGSGPTIGVLRRFREEAAAHPIFSRNFQLAVVGDLLDQGRIDDAIAFQDYYRSTGLNCARHFLQVGKDYQALGLTKAAAGYFKRVLLLEPTNREAADKVREVSEKERNAKGP